MDTQKKREILEAAKREIMRHSLDTFCDSPPSVAHGGRGVEHLADDVLPVILRTAFKIAAETSAVDS
jgi:hypothetical protein